MIRHRLRLLLLPLLLAGCSTPSTVETPAANPEAPAAPGAPMPRLSGDDAPTRKTNALLAAVGANDTDTLKPMDHGAMDHSEYAAKPAAAAGTGTFVCPMHAEVTSARPAECPKCGMALKPKPAQSGGAPHQKHQP